MHVSLSSILSRKRKRKRTNRYASSMLMRRSEQAFLGQWRIVEMEVWDADYFDMDVQAHITIRKDLTGEFQFGLVQGELDGQIRAVDGTPRFDFSWLGFDENDPVNGRGWLQVNGDTAQGRIFIHLGDDSALKAERVQ